MTADQALEAVTTISDARLLELARIYEQYPGSKSVTVCGNGLIEFSRALLAEHEGQRIAELLSVRAALDGEGGSA
jgi:hypothetical protein